MPGQLRRPLAEALGAVGELDRAHEPVERLAQLAHGLGRAEPVLTRDQVLERELDAVERARE